MTETRREDPNPDRPAGGARRDQAESARVLPAPVPVPDRVSAADLNLVAGALLDAARAAGLSLAAAESLTGGRVAAALTSIPGASAVFRGSVTSYATELKASILGVDRELLAAHGAVHPDVARQMAEGVRRLCRAGLGISTTGVAGPDPQDGRPVGTVFTAVSAAEGTWTAAWSFRGDRSGIQDQAAYAALAAALECPAFARR